jgi:hypothetical protein
MKCTEVSHFFKMVSSILWTKSYLTFCHACVTSAHTSGSQRCNNVGYGFQSFGRRSRRHIPGSSMYGGSIFFRDVGARPPHYTLSYSRRVLIAMNRNIYFRCWQPWLCLISLITRHLLRSKLLSSRLWDSNRHLFRGHEQCFELS